MKYLDTGASAFRPVIKKTSLDLVNYRRENCGLNVGEVAAQFKRLAWNEFRRLSDRHPADEPRSVTPQFPGARERNYPKDRMPSVRTVGCVAMQ